MSGTSNSPSSSSSGNDGEGEPPSSSPSVDSREAATVPVFEIGGICWLCFHRPLYTTLITSFLIPHSSFRPFDQKGV